MDITVKVNDELVANALDSADIGYWARVPQGCGDHKKLLDGKATATVEEFDESTGETTKTHTLTGEKVRIGLSIMAEKYPRHFQDVVADNADAETGDVLVQLSLFGEIVYG